MTPLAVAAGPAHTELPPQTPGGPPLLQKSAWGLWVLGMPLGPSKLFPGSSVGLMGWTHAWGKGQLAPGGSQTLWEGGWEGEEGETG